MSVRSNSASVHSKSIVMLLLALVGGSLLAPFGGTGAVAAPLYSMTGSDSLDNPDLSTITRAELAKRVSNAANFHDDPGPQIFQDVPPTHGEFRYVNRLANRGAVGGYRCGSVPEEPCVAPGYLPYYRPDVDALRGQAAKMIAVAAGFSEEPTDQTFQDVMPGSTFYMWVQRLASRGIAEGFQCGTRAQEPCMAPENRPYYRLFDAIAKQHAQNMIRDTFHNDEAK